MLLTRIHGEKPGDGVQLWYEANGWEVRVQFRVMEGDELGELGKVFLYDCVVVAQEELVQVLVDEGTQARICQSCQAWITR